MKTKGCGVASIIDMDDLKAMAAHGMSQKEIANYYGLSRQGLVKILSKNPELQQAFSSGLHHIIVKAVRVLMKKIEAEDTFACVYFLNNRAGWCEERYRKDKVDPDSFPKVNIWLPDNGRLEIKDND